MSNKTNLINARDSHAWLGQKLLLGFLFLKNEVIDLFCILMPLLPVRKGEFWDPWNIDRNRACPYHLVP